LYWKRGEISQAPKLIFDKAAQQWTLIRLQIALQLLNKIKWSRNNLVAVPVRGQICASKQFKFVATTLVSLFKLRISEQFEKDKRLAILPYAFNSNLATKDSLVVYNNFD